MDLIGRVSKILQNTPSSLQKTIHNPVVPHAVEGAGSQMRRPPPQDPWPHRTQQCGGVRCVASIVNCIE
jgi:hypothetical protein